jgi:hypothetical protein
MKIETSVVDLIYTYNISINNTVKFLKEQWCSNTFYGNQIVIIFKVLVYVITKIMINLHLH